jgi:hypothetical protein
MLNYIFLSIILIEHQLNQLKVLQIHVYLQKKMDDIGEKAVSHKGCLFT